ncbi:MAG: penicillin-binding protein 1B [Pseudomonadota bacterium]
MTQRKRSSRKRSTARHRHKSNRGRFTRHWRLMTLLLLAGTVFLALIYTLYLDILIRQQFEGRRWALPARVFARPLEIYGDKTLSAAALVDELKLLRYQRRRRVDEPGEYYRKGNTVILHTRGFPFWDGDEPQRLIRLVFRERRVSGIYDKNSGEDLGLLRLEPVAIASIYPRHHEDRMLVQLADVPPLLVAALLTVEDRNFYGHNGLDVMAVARALLVNLKAGRMVQGGSTLTQQLVKNFFLSNERTLWRKFNEAIMAWLLEWHFSKEEILEAYLNEVYLGQDGERAIHGFGLASQFYFERRLSDLKSEQMAALVALIKGPSYYDPRRHPQRARARRDLVLDLLAEHGHMSLAEADRGKSVPLGVSAKAPSGVSPFPAFVQLVREQLKRDYREEDLRAEGLVIFTTLDPLVQLDAERAITRRLARLDKRRGAVRQKVQGAIVVTSVENGEILALVGGRDPRYAGYNRAMNARRPVGSLMKPVVYLTALSQPRQYTLTTRVDDAPLSLRLSKGNIWSPQNYDRKNHGQVLLRDALVQSYNVSTARLGLAIGLDAVTDNLYRLGLSRNVPRYPSMLLGAVELSPLEVSQIYQTLAAGGYRVPLKAIREVMNRQGLPLRRYPLKLERTVDPAAVYLVTSAMYEVTQQGTARSLKTLLPEELKVAGKTGTTNGLRDSWFAGFSGEHLVVVWVGQDNNRPTGLTGSTGALPVWADIMNSISTSPLNMVQPPEVEWMLIDPVSGLVADEGCSGAEWFPFIKDSAPKDPAPCGKGVYTGVDRAVDWFSELFE